MIELISALVAVTGLIVYLRKDKTVKRTHRLVDVTMGNIPISLVGHRVETGIYGSRRVVITTTENVVLYGVIIDDTYFGPVLNDESINIEIQDEEISSDAPHHLQFIEKIDFMIKRFTREHEKEYLD